ncbi:MAG: ATP-dependent DNA helicase [Alphaproteobacteria bacterium]|nr:ATP-dependent DNA helicase [Alphaproteobacteria bacterium SS10]
MTINQSALLSDQSNNLPASTPNPLTQLPVMVMGAAGPLRRAVTGEIAKLSIAEARDKLTAEPHLICHGRAIGRRLEMKGVAPGFDLLELFAFCRPAQFCLPTVGGLAELLDLTKPAPGDMDAQFEAMPLIGHALLEELAAPMRGDRDIAGPIAFAMAEGGWPWGKLVLDRLGMNGPPTGQDLFNAFAVWRRAPEWEDRAPPPPPGNDAVDPPAARTQLDRLLAARGGQREARPQQADYASATAAAFRPRAAEGEPNVILAEAGTGVGKTLGYLAPATLWSQMNEGPVWVATYTRNLQRQIDDELQRLSEMVPPEQVVVRKGRENFLCLLNFEEAIQRIATTPQNAVPLGLLTRWASASRDGALVAGDLPGWLTDLAGRSRTAALADKRGECIYAACPHYRRCYIERNTRAAKHARVVVANHALVLYHAATAAQEAIEAMPTHYVFDEGHHLFDAADSAFGIALTAQEAAEQRRWLLGAETGRSSRARGLARRVEDLLAGDEEGLAAMDAAQEAARTLPSQGWQKRLGEDGAKGAGERFFAAVRDHVYTHAGGKESPYDLEAPPLPMTPALIEQARGFADGLGRLIDPLSTIKRRLIRLMDERAEDWDTDTRQRADSLARGIERRVEQTYRGWRMGLVTLADFAEASAGISNDNPASADPGLSGAVIDEKFVDWFAVSRIEGRDIDIGYHRHWVDPTEPMVETVLTHAQGAVVTSATLTDGGAKPIAGEEDQDAQRWVAAERVSGANHLPITPVRARVRSPFDYPSQTRAYIVTDVNKHDMDQLATAYRALFEASGGGALGLFTAIQRLRAVHGRLAPAMEAAGLPLYAQHADGIDPSTLVDIFRGERDACLLGTDAIRDGVDVPGDALRLVVFDRVPWPRPSLIHKARRQRFGGQAYDDEQIRLRLRQAFGRLIRRGDDRGVFVMLDSAVPSRLLPAFPEGVEVQRVGLSAAIAGVRDFVSSQ